MMDAAVSEARNTAMPPSSSVVAKRLFGCCAKSTSRMTSFTRDAVGLGLAVDLRLDERGVDIARANGVAGDAQFRRLECRHLSEPKHTMFCRHIGRLEGRAHQPMS